MGFTYSGTVQEVTDGIQSVISLLQQGQPPVGTPLADGLCAVEPLGVTASISGGAFSVPAEDDSSALAPYRLAITTALPDFSYDGPRVAYRGPDLFRTGTGWTETGLDIYLKVLTPFDLAALGTALGMGTPIIFPIPFATLKSAAGSLPDGIVINEIQQAGNGLVSVSIKRGDLTGSFTASVTPDTSADYHRYAVLTLVDLNLDGIEGWFAEFTEGEDLIREKIQTGLNSAADALNVQIASEIGQAHTSLPKSPASTLTLTLLDVTVTASGVDATPVLGLIQNSVADPCQELRNKISDLKRDLATAGPDHLSHQVIAAMETRLSDNQHKLQACVASHQAGPHPTLRDGVAVKNVGAKEA